MSKRNIYVASSWRNVFQPAIIRALKNTEHDAYDFRQEDASFHWSDVMESYHRPNPPHAPEQMADVDDYIESLNHPLAEEGFNRDFKAMEWADTCLLILPCGRSAHLEAGWFAADPDRELVILLPEPTIIPELMYRMADTILPSFNDFLGWAGIQPELGYKSWTR